MSSEEVQIEPIPGLPHALPPGEHIVWQGQPRWKGIALRTFHVGWLAAYFGVFATARGVMAFVDGHSVAAALLATLTVLPLAALCLGVLSLMAWLNARASMYTITTRRIVMRIGVAFPVTFNLPFKRLAAADLRTGGNGLGDIALQLKEPDRIAWLHLWPHTRPWRLARAQPMLRALVDASAVAALLAKAVRDWSMTENAPTVVAAQEEAAMSHLANVAPSVSAANSGGGA